MCTGESHCHLSDEEEKPTNPGTSPSSPSSAGGTLFSTTEQDEC